MHSIDKYGRVWNLPVSALCPDCRQPQDIGDCDHVPLELHEVRKLGGVLPPGLTTHEIGEITSLIERSREPSENGTADAIRTSILNSAYRKLITSL